MTGTGALNPAWSRLTGAIVQLQTSIHASTNTPKIPPQNGVLEYKSTDGTMTSKFSIQLTTQINHDTLKAQLTFFEHQLKERGQWHIPPNFQPDPYLSIDLSDMDEAISHLETALDSPRFPRPAHSPQAVFSAQKWEWDFPWSEWYYIDADSGHYVYLTEWKLDESAREWEMVCQGHKSMEDGLAVLGCWEDWQWDEEWGEWWLPLQEAGETGVTRGIYASAWERTEAGDWVHLERT